MYIYIVGNNIPDIMIDYIMNYPSTDKESILANMARSRVEFDRLLSIIKKFNIEFNNIDKLFNWFEYSTLDDKILILKYIIKVYEKLFNNKANIDKFLRDTFLLLQREEYADIAKDIVSIIYSVPFIRNEYPQSMKIFASMRIYY